MMESYNYTRKVSRHPRLDMSFPLRHFPGTQAPLNAHLSYDYPHAYYPSQMLVNRQPCQQNFSQPYGRLRHPPTFPMPCYSRPTTQLQQIYPQQYNPMPCSNFSQLSNPQHAPTQHQETNVALPKFSESSSVQITNTIQPAISKPAAALGKNHLPPHLHFVLLPSHHHLVPALTQVFDFVKTLRSRCVRADLDHAIKDRIRIGTLTYSDYVKLIQWLQENVKDCSTSKHLSLLNLCINIVLELRDFAVSSANIESMKNVNPRNIKNTLSYVQEVYQTRKIGSGKNDSPTSEVHASQLPSLTEQNDNEPEEAVHNSGNKSEKHKAATDAVKQELNEQDTEDSKEKMDIKLRKVLECASPIATKLISDKIKEFLNMKFPLISPSTAKEPSYTQKRNGLPEKVDQVCKTIITEEREQGHYMDDAPTVSSSNANDVIRKDKSNDTQRHTEKHKLSEITKCPNAKSRPLNKKAGLSIDYFGDEDIVRSKKKIQEVDISMLPNIDSSVWENCSDEDESYSDSGHGVPYYCADSPTPSCASLLDASDSDSTETAHDSDDDYDIDLPSRGAHLKQMPRRSCRQQISKGRSVRKRAFIDLTSETPKDIAQEFANSNDYLKTLMEEVKHWPKPVVVIEKL